MWNQRKSIRGVICTNCRAWIRGGKKYWQEEYFDYSMRKTTNLCPVCTFEESQRVIAYFQRIEKHSKKLKDIYDKLDETICLKCKNKYKHVTGECQPKGIGCRYKEMGEKHDNKRRKKV